jgi:Protein of unknown function (DUF2909)
MKPLLVVFLLFIVFSLGKAMASMTSGAGTEASLRVVHALTWRIGLSVALFILVIAGSHFGWIAPNGPR